MSNNLRDLSDAGVSIWLDDLSRARLTSGSLADLAADAHVTGVTTNPTIFAHALADRSPYYSQLTGLAGEPIDFVVRQLTATDVRSACDVLRSTYIRTRGRDGRVSIEVEPALARDSDATVTAALELHHLVHRENVMIKIPATETGLDAIRRVTARGVSVNVTLMFSLDRYAQVIDAYISGLEEAMAEERPLAKIHSVASLFISRIDVEVDRRLDAIGTPDALALRGRAAIATARLAYRMFTDAFARKRFRRLALRGAHRQRPLWASTSVKNPDYADTRYVTELVANDCVTTLPEKTLLAVAEHGTITGDTITSHYAEAEADLAAIRDVGVDLDDVERTLEQEGIDTFSDAWDELLASLEKARDGMPTEHPPATRYQGLL